MKNAKWIILIVALFIVSLSIFAQGPAEGSPEDNACNVGGVWEDKCGWPTQAQRDWAWTCGWFVARYVTGGGNSGVPIWCNYAPSAPPANTDVPDPEPLDYTTCYSTYNGGWDDFQMKGPLGTRDNMVYYQSRYGQCDTERVWSDRFFVVSIPGTPTPAQATAVCNSVWAGSVVYGNDGIAHEGYPVPSHWYFCWNNVY